MDHRLLGAGTAVASVLASQAALRAVLALSGWCPLGCPVRHRPSSRWSTAPGHREGDLEIVYSQSGYEARQAMGRLILDEYWALLPIPEESLETATERALRLLPCDEADWTVEEVTPLADQLEFEDRLPHWWEAQATGVSCLRVPTW